MSVFVNSLKTFESDITGEVKDYKINNAVWVIMKAKFGMSQTEWAIEYGKEEVFYGAKFVTCVLKANGIETNETEVLENTNAVDLANFIAAYQVGMFPKKDDEEENEEEKSEGK